MLCSTENMQWTFSGGPTRKGFIKMMTIKALKLVSCEIEDIHGISFSLNIIDIVHLSDKITCWAGIVCHVLLLLLHINFKILSKARETLPTTCIIITISWNTLVVESVWLDSLFTTHYKAHYPADGKMYSFLSFSYILILIFIYFKFHFYH